MNTYSISSPLGYWTSGFTVNPDAFLGDFISKKFKFKLTTKYSLDKRRPYLHWIPLLKPLCTVNINHKISQVAFGYQELSHTYVHVELWTWQDEHYNRLLKMQNNLWFAMCIINISLFSICDRNKQTSNNYSFTGYTKRQNTFLPISRKWKNNVKIFSLIFLFHNFNLKVT